jgi:hypothetical protein
MEVPIFLGSLEWRKASCFVLEEVVVSHVMIPDKKGYVAMRV